MNRRMGLIGIVALLTGCGTTPKYFLSPEHIPPQISCESQYSGDILVKDECRLGPVEIYKTDYSENGPGGKDDQRYYFGYFTSGRIWDDKVAIDPIEEKWLREKPGHKKIVGEGHGNCFPYEPCSEDNRGRYIWDFKSE